MGPARRLSILPAFALVAGAQSPAPQASEPQAQATLAPYFFVQSADAAVDQLPLKRASAKVAIAGVIAEVRITQVYRNEGRTPLEAVYVFPGSTRAAVHGLTMTLGERVIRAEIQETAAARRTYEQARQEGRAASLLEQHRPNVFQMNVANILPGEDVKVELAYTELLVPVDGEYQFTYPTVVGPRYANRTEPGERWVANPYTHQGEKPAYGFDLEVNLAAGMPIQKVACPSHKTLVAFDAPGAAGIRLDPSETHGGDRDFILKYRLAGDQVQTGLLLAKGERENFFLLMMQPPRRVVPEALPPRDYVFVVDVSGSMGGYPLETSKQLMRDLLRDLRPQDRFNLLTFSGGSAVWAPEGSRLATPENVHRANAFIDSLAGGGGTELLPALRAALKLPRAAGTSRSFVIATDGYVQVEPEAFDLVRAHLGDANFFAFGIGSSVNRHLIEGLARAGQGEAFVVTRPEAARAEAKRFKDYISGPVLTQIKVAGEGFDIYDVEPAAVPDVLAERPVLVFGKWRGEPAGTLAVSGQTGQGPLSRTFQVGPGLVSADPDALRYLWARHRIQTLADCGVIGPSRAKDITALGLAYNLLTGYTSFVAVDQAVRNPGGTAASVVQPLPMPQGVSDRAVASLSPGIVTRSAASACVEVVASTGAYACADLAVLDGGVEVALPVRTKRGPALLAARGGALKLEPGLPAALAWEALARLRALQAAGAFRNLRGRFTLTLAVDAAGTVTGLVKGLTSKGLADELEAAVRGWRFQHWPRGGRAALRIPFRVGA